MIPVAEQTIFISIASYCDPLLAFTISSALNNAANPQNLRFGIVDQSPASQRLSMQVEPPLNYVQVDPLDTRGVCWARSLAMSFYNGEDWFLQLDSHMFFEPNWDIKLIAEGHRCAKLNPDFVISSYPNAFELDNGKVIKKVISEHPLVIVVHDDVKFDNSDILQFTFSFAEANKPVLGFALGAGCIFAPGKIVQAFPYDPHFYFFGEEQAYALRLYTHGWDIMHVCLPIYHYYQLKGDIRPRHWDEEQDSKRAIKHDRLVKKATARLHTLINGGDLGVYSLGTTRTVKDYADFCGIDYMRQTLNDKAYLGPWVFNS